METKKQVFKTVDDYIAAAPPPAQEQLNELRKVIRSVAVHANEMISYNMPAYKQNGTLVYFAANKNHIGFYPTPTPINVFSRQLRPYKTSKGAIQFPLHVPLPLSLIKEIVRFRMQEDNLTAAAKQKKSTLPK